MDTLEEKENKLKTRTKRAEKNNSEWIGESIGQSGVGRRQKNAAGWWNLYGTTEAAGTNGCIDEQEWTKKIFFLFCPKIYICLWNMKTRRPVSVRAGPKIGNTKKWWWKRMGRVGWLLKRGRQKHKQMHDEFLFEKWVERLWMWEEIFFSGF